MNLGALELFMFFLLTAGGAMAQRIPWRLSVSAVICFAIQQLIFN
jgi:hypothetical protein